MQNRLDEGDRDPGELESGRMGFLEHLDELRTRLIHCCIALVAGMAVSFLFIHRIAAFVLAAIAASLSGSTLIYTRPGEGFAFYLDVALIGGVVLAAPFVTYEAWRFVAPGLYAKEKRLVVPLLGLAVSGSIAGALFSHFVLFPGMMAFFREFDSPVMRFMPRVEDTFALYKNTLIGMVMVFQIPTLVFVLARIGAVTAGFLWRHMKHAVLAAVIAGAILTPSADPWNQLVFAAPMIGLYIIGILVAWAVYPRRAADDPVGPALRLVVAAGVYDHSRRRLRSTTAAIRRRRAAVRDSGLMRDSRFRMRDERYGIRDWR
jgi:sec-independent protein translocase protein TatC